MTIPISRRLLFVFASLLLLLAACDSGTESTSVEPAAVSPGAMDDRIQSQVEAAIAGASDLPAAGFSVEVSQGVVHVSGSLDCEDCGGMRTPANVNTIQQTLGAVVRAIPGVTQVQFDLTTGS